MPAAKKKHENSSNIYSIRICGSIDQTTDDMAGYTSAALRGIGAMLPRRPAIPATDFNRLKELNILRSYRGRSLGVKSEPRNIQMRKVNKQLINAAENARSKQNSIKTVITTI